jgi:hypothetical protein
MTHPKYQSVNGAWPDQVPELTGQEALAAAKRLWRLAMGKPCPMPVKLARGQARGRGRRGVRIFHGVLWINELAGWRGMVHSLSHRCHYRLHPGAASHDDLGRHAFVERTMIEHVVNSGWLDGKLRRPEKPKPSREDFAKTVRAGRAQRVDQAIVRWERKLARAERALRKLRRQRAYYAQPKIFIDSHPGAGA